MLAFAVEEATAAEPEANQVSWLGSARGCDALAVLDRQGLECWRIALQAIGLRAREVYCEILMLPRASGEWSLAWYGVEGFVRTGDFEGGATDLGSHTLPPLSLRMLLDEGERPSAIAIYGIAPDLAAWQRELGIPLRAAGAWDWRSAGKDAGVSPAQERKRWRVAPGRAEGTAGRGAAHRASSPCCVCRSSTRSNSRRSCAWWPSSAAPAASSSARARH